MDEPRISARPSLTVAHDLLGAVGLPTEDLSLLPLGDFFFAGLASAPTGLVGLEMNPPVALLRSLVVLPQARRSGLGSRLVAHAEAHARSHGVRTIYLLTTTAERFFAARGYVLVQRDAAPAAIRETREFARLCPASAALMSKEL